MPVDFVGSTLCCRVFLSGLIGNVSVDMSRVGLKLSQGVKSLSLDLLILLMLLTVPHRYNKLFQPVGRLSFFLINKFKVCLSCMVLLFFTMGAQGQVPLSFSTCFLEAGGFPFNILDLVGHFLRLQPIPRWWRRAWCCFQPVAQSLISRGLQRRRGCRCILQGTSFPPSRRRGLFPLHVWCCLFPLLRPHLPRQT